MPATSPCREPAGQADTYRNRPHRRSESDPVGFHISFSQLWQVFSALSRGFPHRYRLLRKGRSAPLKGVSYPPPFPRRRKVQAITFPGLFPQALRRNGKDGFGFPQVGRHAENFSGPLDSSRIDIKKYRNSQGGVQVPTGGEPLVRGSPRARFQGKSADPVQVRGRR